MEDGGNRLGDGCGVTRPRYENPYRYVYPQVNPDNPLTLSHGDTDIYGSLLGRTMRPEISVGGSSPDGSSVYLHTPSVIPPSLSSLIRTSLSEPDTVYYLGMGSGSGEMTLPSCATTLHQPGVGVGLHDYSIAERLATPVVASERLGSILHSYLGDTLRVGQSFHDPAPLHAGAFSYRSAVMESGSLALRVGASLEDQSIRLVGTIAGNDRWEVMPDGSYRFKDPGVSSYTYQYDRPGMVYLQPSEATRIASITLSSSLDPKDTEALITRSVGYTYTGKHVGEVLKTTWTGRTVPSIIAAWRSAPPPPWARLPAGQRLAHLLEMQRSPSYPLAPKGEVAHNDPIEVHDRASWTLCASPARSQIDTLAA